MEIKQEIAGVKNQPINMFVKVCRLTVLIPLTRPTPKIAPITAWEVETGTPTNVKKWTVIASARTTISAEKGSRRTSFRPTVSITGRLKVNMPRAMLNPPINVAENTPI
jgi:hypothetical protein